MKRYLRDSEAWGLRPLPVILPALSDELLSSWLRRHADFYGVGEDMMLRHCVPNKSSLRALDLCLTADDERRLSAMFRCSPCDIRNMTHLKGGLPNGLLATAKQLQVCRRCVAQHQACEITRGARLRSWMEGWRLSCPVCGMRLDNARPLDLLTKVDAATPLLVERANEARTGAALIDRSIRQPGPIGTSLVELMRILLLSRSPSWVDRCRGIFAPRLLDIIVPGFDRYMQQHHPEFRRHGGLLLAISVRIPVLAGVAAVATRPEYWTDRLVDAASGRARERVRACVGNFSGREAHRIHRAVLTRRVIGERQRAGSGPSYTEILKIAA